MTKRDLKQAEKAMWEFLESLGCDMEDPNVEGTPARVTKMFAEEILAGSLDNVKLTTFETPDSGNQFVIVADIPVHSLCSHHLMPIRGVAHIGAYFIADENGTTHLPGLSKYARIVEAYSRRLQLQERLTRQVTQEIRNSFNADFVYVVIDAEHHCMMHRGVKTHESATITNSVAVSDQFLDRHTINEMILQFNSLLSMKRKI